MNKSLLLATVALTVIKPLQAKPFEGSHVGAHLGTTKPSSTNGIVINSVNIPGEREEDWGWSGGVSYGYLGRVNLDLLGGFALEGNMERTTQKHKFPGENLEVFRRYNINLLGKVGYMATPCLMPYVGVGPTFTNFKFKTMNHSKEVTSFGVAAALGADYVLSDNLAANAQYLYTNYGRNTLEDSERNIQGKVHAPESYHAFTVGVKYKI